VSERASFATDTGNTIESSERQILLATPFRPAYSGLPRSAGLVSVTTIDLDTPLPPNGAFSPCHQ
jgi:hypothetical protein